MGRDEIGIQWLLEEKHKRQDNVSMVTGSKSKKMIHRFIKKTVADPAFSSPEAALLLVSTKNRDLWPGPTTFLFWMAKLNGLIRFVRLDSEHVQSNGKSVNRGLPVLDMARGCDSWCCQKEPGIWGLESMLIQIVGGVILLTLLAFLPFVISSFLLKIRGCPPPGPSPGSTTKNQPVFKGYAIFWGVCNSLCQNFLNIKNRTCKMESTCLMFFLMALLTLFSAVFAEKGGNSRARN